MNNTGTCPFLPLPQYGAALVMLPPAVFLCPYCLRSCHTTADAVQLVLPTGVETPLRAILLCTWDINVKVTARPLILTAELSTKGNSLFCRPI